VHRKCLPEPWTNETSITSIVPVRKAFSLFTRRLKHQPDPRIQAKTSSAQRGWNPTPVREKQWKAPIYWTKQSQAFEQDHAAGGRDHRVVDGSGGALGRVVLQPRNRRLYAELRWQVNKKQYSRYLGELTADNRAANLAAAWQRAHDFGLTTTRNTATQSASISQE
jgi:hypothetical protein